MPRPVTDPALLAQLNGGGATVGKIPVNDPELLARLNAETGPDPTEGMSKWQLAAAGAGRQMVGRARSLGNAVGLVSDEDLKESQQRDKPLTDKFAAKAGAFGADLAMSLPFARGGMAGAVGSGALMGFTDPDTSGSIEDRAIRTAIGGGLGAVGQKVAGWASKKITDRLAKAALRKAQDAPKREAIEAGMKLGMKVPPSTANPKLGNRLLESFAGKEAIEQEAALHNADIMQSSMRRFLGLSEDTPMTMDTLKAVHTQANQAREAVKGLGQPMVFDDVYAKALTGIEGSAAGASRSFPGAGSPSVRAALQPYGYQPPATGLLKAARGNEIGPPRTFKPEDAIDAIKTLREEAAESFATRQGRVGRAQIAASKALEDLIERNLGKQGLAGAKMLEAFKAGRVLDAKAYAVQNVINKATGNVQGAKAAKLLAKDAPLTGELRDVARFAAALPSVTREPTRSAGVNALTTLFGVEAAMLGHPAPLLLPPARFGMAKALLSEPFQKARALPNYNPGLKGPRLAQGLGRSLVPGMGLYPEEEEQQ